MKKKTIYFMMLIAITVFQFGPLMTNVNAEITNSKIDSVYIDYIYTTINGFEIETPKYYQSKTEFYYKYSIILMKASNNPKLASGQEACACYINYPMEELSFFFNEFI